MRERLITIDINEVNFKILKYKQFDNNNILKVEITEKKKLIDLSEYSAYFFFKLPSGEILQKNTTIEDNKIKVFLDSGVFSESGRVKVEITLSNAEQIVTTFTMYFEIEETIDRNEAIQSKPEWDIISDILNGTGGTGGSIDVSNKVDKEEGKGLISLSEIERLANVDNYDDTEIRELIEEKADKEDLHEHENKDILDEITEEKIEQWNKGGFSGDYNDLINTPIIPNIEGLATETYVQNKIAEAQLDGGEVDLSNYATKDELHEHTNKDVLDNITSEKVNDWDNKSEFDGDYNSLTNKPTIPSLEGYATETYVKNEIANAQLNSDDNEVDLSGFATKDELNAKADVEDIPTKVSQLENDSNYLTSVPSEYITETELNDKGYLTEHQDISGKVDKEEGKSLIADSEIERLANVDNYTHPSTHNATMITEDESHRFVTDTEKALWNNKEEKNHTHEELHEHANKDILDDITSNKIDEWDNKSEFDGDYNSLTNKPTIPTRVSQLTNDGIYATETYVQNKIAEAQLSGEEVDLSGFATKDELNAKADVEDIPTKVSQLENDKGYLTEHINIDGKVDKVEGKSLISDSEIERLANVDNYTHPSTHNATMITEDETHRFVTDEERNYWNNKEEKNHTHEELHEHDNKNILDNITSEKVNDWDNKSEFDGDYNSLTNKPTIPTKVSELENDNNYLTSIPSEYVTETELNNKGYLTEHQDLSDYATKDDLKTKADTDDIPTKVSQLENDKGYLTEHINIDGKVDKEDGKGLISLSEIERLANVDNYTHPSTHNATMITEDENHRFVTDEEKELWNNKSEFDGDYNSLTNKPTIPSIEGLATETYVENEINKKINVDLISNSINETVLTLTNDRYQVAEIVDGTTIALPVVETYTEIHLFFTTTSDITITMPNGIKYQKIPTITADKTYEFIFTYTNADINWVFGYIEYTN